MTQKNARIAFLIFFAALVAAFLYMAAPLMKGAFCALIIAVIFHPVYKCLLKIFRQHNYLSAVIASILSFCVVLVPIAIILTFLASNLVVFATRLAEQLQSGQMATIVDQIGNTLNGIFASLTGVDESPINLRITIIGLLKTAGKFLYQFSPHMLASTAKFGINFIVLVIFLVVFFAEGSTLFRWLLKALPLAKDHQEEISRDIRVMISAILFGMIATALVQGTLIGAGFWVAGFSEPVMWGTIAMLAAFIPIVGAAACYIGASLVLLAMGRPEAAAFFMLYGIAVISSVDNVIKPLVMGTHMRVHPALLFVALLGGVRAFGAIGIVFGPVLLAVFLASLRIYQREFISKTYHSDR